VHEVADRIERAHADGLTTDKQLTIDPRREVWSEQREALHDAIIEDIYGQSGNVPEERQAIVAGGLPGAGKSTVLEKYAGDVNSRYFRIDPDKIKSEMAQRGMVPKVEGLSPMEAADLVHEESSHIAKRLARRAQADGKNMIWDITMSSRTSTEDRIEKLRSNDYTHIEGIYVDISPELSEARAEARHRRGHDEYRVGQGQGGRFVPAGLILGQAEHEWGSINRRTFEEVKHRFDKWSVYDNSTDGCPPVLADSSERRNIHDQ